MEPFKGFAMLLSPPTDAVVNGGCDADAAPTVLVPFAVLSDHPATGLLPPHFTIFIPLFIVLDAAIAFPPPEDTAATDGDSGCGPLLLNDAFLYADFAKLLGIEVGTSVVVVVAEVIGVPFFCCIWIDDDDDDDDDDFGELPIEKVPFSGCFTA